MPRAKRLTILEVNPGAGLAGGELAISCRGFSPGLTSRVLVGEVEAPIISASDDRIIVRLPESPHGLGLSLKVGDSLSDVFPFSLGTRIAGDLHPVTNPVIAPDGSIITTISGARGHQIEQPLIRVTRSGDKAPFQCEIMNPTGLAFSKDGQLYISSRHDGTVLRYTDFEQLEVVAEDLGIPCGIVFDSKGFLYVGDRTGRIYRIDRSGSKEEFTQLEPSISAYHLAIDSGDRLYVTGPTFSIRDCLFRISQDGESEVLLRGLARPQGLAFLPSGDLLVCAGFEGKKGVFKYSPQSGALQHYIAAPVLVGLAISGQEIFLAENNSLYVMQLPGQNHVN
jgi:sugar lactone lactonase YvrE